MIEKLAKSLVAWQIKNEYLKPADQNLYQYGFELLIGQAVNLLIACLLDAKLTASMAPSGILPAKIHTAQIMRFDTIVQTSWLSA